MTADEINVRFLRPIYLNEDIQCWWNEAAQQLTLYSGELLLTLINLKIAEVIPQNILLTEFAKSRSMPSEPTFSDCSGLVMQPLKIHGNPVALQKNFPFASRAYGWATISEIAALSYVVGMDCPGLHSLFASLKIKIIQNEKLNPYFSVTRSDERSNSLKMSVVAHTLSGEIQAFYRPSPTHGSSICNIAQHIKRDEFKNVHALIVGGSRGLGALTAKIITAGGGKVIITYNVGKAEADELSKVIDEFGGDCQSIQMTVNRSASLPANLPKFNQLYYFATPKILSARNSEFNDELFKDFSEIYVDSFESICCQVMRLGNFCSIFYPSTTFIDDKLTGFSAYIEAKIAGEILCSQLNKNKLLEIMVPRLPKMLTDQTQSFLKSNVDNSLNIMLPLVREMKVI